MLYLRMLGGKGRGVSSSSSYGHIVVGGGGCVDDVAVWSLSLPLLLPAQERSEVLLGATV